MIVLDKFGIPRKLSDVAAVERLFNLKEKSGSDPWPVIEEILKMWEKKARKANQWDSYLIELQSTRETRKNQFAASDADDVHGGILRYTLDIPEWVAYAIRMLYTPEELPMNRDFYHAFADRFPKMKVAEKI